ncbi:MAG: LysR family transcriptional regulator [Burkholderiaceae bacterium]
MNISLRQLVSFREVSRARSFTEAAEQLHTTQSNLSTAVRDLESAIGARLIDRTTKRFELTEIGQEFLDAVERVLDDLKRAVDDVSVASRLERGELTLGTTPLLASTFLSELLGRFCQRHPQLGIRLKDRPTSELVSLLRSREIELAIGSFHETDQDIALKPLFVDRLVVLGHPGLDIPSPCPWQVLLRLPVVSIVKNSSVGQLIHKAVWRATQKEYRPMIEAGNWATVVSLTQSLRAACVVPRYAAARMVSTASGRELAQFELAPPRVRRTISVAWLSSRSLSPAGKAFLALLAEDSSRVAEDQVTRRYSSPPAHCVR